MKSNIGDFEMEFDGQRRHPLVPPLNLPRNAVEDWRHQQILEKAKQQQPPSITSSEHVSLSDIQSEHR